MRMVFAAASMGLATLLTAGILASPTAAQGEGAGPKFKKGSLPSEGNTQYNLIISEDKKSAVILFDGLEMEWSGRTPLFATRVFSISIPLAGAEKGVKLEVFLEGAVAHEKGTDVSLVTTVNGRAHVMDFAKFSAPPSGESVNDGCDKSGSGSAQERDVIKRKLGAKHSDRPRKPDIAGKPSPNAQAGLETDYSFVQCILLDAPSASALRLNVIFALNRHNPETQGYMNVTTMGAIVRSEAKLTK
jgi:hypothetical protein